MSGDGPARSAVNSFRYVFLGILGLPFLAALAVLPAGGASASPVVAGEATPPGPSSSSGSGCVLMGTVADSLSGRPVAQVSVSLSNAKGADLTGLDGRYLITGVASGVQELRLRHVAYEATSRLIRVPASCDTFVVNLRLRPRVYPVQELLVNADRVVPLTDGEQTRYTIPHEALGSWGADEPFEIVRRLPGVVLLGDRPFFRGVGMEHVLPLLDGVPAREPLRGQWILAPPDALQLTQFTPGAFDAEYGQALAGVLSLELPEGSPRHHLRVGAQTDRYLEALQRSQTTDIVRATAGGPLPVRAFTYSASWQGRLTDGSHRYDHGRPGQTLLGYSLGERMDADLVGMARLVWDSRKHSHQASLLYLGSESRVKPYYYHYSGRGWVGYQPEYDSYTAFVDPGATSDSVVFYDAPAHVPTHVRASRLLQGSTTKRWGTLATLRCSLRAAEHRYSARADGVAFDDTEAARYWIRHETTRFSPQAGFTHQAERFFCLHGYYPEYEDGRSREISGTTGLKVRSGGHDLSAGGGATLGRHRFFAARSIVDWSPLGSLTRWMHTVDRFAYLQDTWHSDLRSSMTLALRWDDRRISQYPGEAHDATLSPRIGFCQPFSDRDALHVQYGVLYQFPMLLDQFLRQTDASQPFADVTAQASRAFEMGIQHHLCEHAVLYVAVHAREYSDLAFSLRDAAEADELFPGIEGSPPSMALESKGVEVLLDHQFHPALVGQIHAEVGDENASGVTVPWGRAVTISGWLTARPRTALELSLFGRWDTGQPYSVCLSRTACSRGRLYAGTLPSPLDLDLSTRWTPGEGHGRAHLTLEIRNLLDRRIATFNFGLYATSVNVGQFIAYYDRYRNPGGYLVNTGDGIRAIPIDNPLTRTDGRNLRLGVEVEL
jgi:hypothetical protein